MNSLARAWLLLAFAAAACGTDHGSATDGGTDAGASTDTGPEADAGDTSGAADSIDASAVTITGTIGGAPLDAISALAGTTSQYSFVFTLVHTLHHEVAIADFADYCGNEDVTGRMLYLDFFQNPSLADSRVTQPGTFEIWLPALNGGEPIPTDDRAVATFAETGPNGGGGQVAQSGSVSVTDVSEAGIAGTFDLVFEDGHLTGSFEAPLCEVWSRNASIPGTGPN